LQVPEKKKSYREIREEQLAAERAAKEAAEAEEVGQRHGYQCLYFDTNISNPVFYAIVSGYVRVCEVFRKKYDNILS
jgi:hypothetical protein